MLSIDAYGSNSLLCKGIDRYLLLNETGSQGVDRHLQNATHVTNLLVLARI